LTFILIERKNYEVPGIEKKLGLKASATCDVAFDRSEAQLVGQEGYGLVRYVIGMLNGARMSVASQGTGMATAAYREALKYATERIQFGQPLIEIPAVRRMLDRMEREIAAMRCLMIESARSVDRYHWRLIRLTEAGTNDREIRNDESIKKNERLASTLTPMSKYYMSEMCNSLIYDALQIFGGAGYIEEYDLARLYRDARITNIYDGTTQIQVNAAIGGIVSGMSEKGQFREHINAFFQTYEPSSLARELLEILEEVVRAYRALPGSSDKEGFAFEVVETATRLLNGLLLEKTVYQLAGDDRQAHRRKLTDDYHIDSIAIARGNLYRLQARATTAVT
ncbi:MAG: acyl-CoA dehydrogenase, partial [Leptospiraceae bacterium]|nr:acyl-CoA dehydrogenase [Leptospiraceae bacterium]